MVHHGEVPRSPPGLGRIVHNRGRKELCEPHPEANVKGAGDAGGGL